MKHPTPAAANPTLRLDYAVLSTGIRLRYADHGAHGGKTAILLHGYADSWFSWSAVLAQLSETIHVIAPDLRGHGDSDKPANGYAVADFAADIIALMDALGIEKAALVGHSLGSFVAQEIAIRHQQRVTKLALLGSATTLNTSPLQHLNTTIQALDRISPAFIRTFQRKRVGQRLSTAMMQRLVTESQKVPLTIWKKMFAATLPTDNHERIAAISVPTLVIQGTADRLCSANDQQLLVKKLSNCTPKSYAGIGHAPHWEAPTAVCRDLETFLSL